MNTKHLPQGAASRPSPNRTQLDRDHHVRRSSLVAACLLFVFNGVSAFAIPNTTTNRYATAEDAAYWPTVNVGDYIFFRGNQQPSNSIYAAVNHVDVVLPVGKKILIYAGQYTRIHIEGIHCQSTASQPTIVTNLGGQVRWGYTTVSQQYRSLELTGFANVFLTGKYDPVTKTGDPGFLGHDGGNALGSGDYYERYGLFANQRWSGMIYGTSSPNCVRITGFDTCKVSYVAAWGDGFAGFNIKTDNPAVPKTVTVDVQDCFSGFSSGEGFYIGNTSTAAYQQDFIRLTLRNNIVVCPGTEAYQTNCLLSGSVIENNVAIGSATFFRTPFQDFYQQGLQQLAFVEGGVTVRNNLLTGGAGTQTSVTYSPPGTRFAGTTASTAPILFRDNYFGYGRMSTFYMNPGTDGATPYQLIDNVFGPTSVPHTNDAYTSYNEPRAGVNVANSVNPVLLSGNRFDPARPGYYVSTGSGANVTESGNVSIEAATPMFKNLGFPDGVDFRRFTFWAPTYTTVEKSGQTIPYKQGDIVYYYETRKSPFPEGDTRMFQCLVDHTNSTDPNTSPVLWQPLTWNGRNLPPLDVRVVPNTYYNYRAMGLIYNEANTTAVDITPPVLTLNGGDISMTKGTSFTDPGWQAIDSKDGDLSGVVTSWWIGASLNVNVAGEYYRAYRVVDMAGNVSLPLIRVVTVSDPGVTISKLAKINMHRNAPVHATLPDWCDLGNSTLGLVHAAGATPTVTLTTVYDINNVTTNWTLKIDCVDGGYSEHYGALGNTTGLAIGDFPAAVTKVGVRIRDPFENPCVLVFTGMDAAKYYDIRYTGYILGAGSVVNAKLTESVAGRGDSINVQGNSTEIGEVRSVKPDVGGSMSLIFTTDTPYKQPNISGLIIQEKSGFGSTTQQPAIAAIPNQTMDQDTTLSGIPVTLSDSDSVAGTLLVWGRSSNPSLIKDSNVAVSGTGLTRSLSITPQTGMSGTATITLVVCDGWNTSNRSFLVTVNQPLAYNLTGAGLMGANIGPSAAGSSRVLAAGDWEVNGSGTGIAGTADSFHYEAADMSGDFQIFVNVKSLTSTGATPRAGIMLRESNSANARMVYLSTTGGTSYQWGSRTVVGGTVTATTPAGSYGYPNAWLGLRRSGDVVTLLVSNDDITYTAIGSVTLTGLAATVKAGVFSSSGTAGVNARAVMSGYEVSMLPIFEQPFAFSSLYTDYFSASAPSADKFNDIGAESLGGTWSINGGRLRLVRAGQSGTSNGAGFTRWTDFAGPPTVLYVTMDFGVSVNTTQSGLVNFEFSKLTAIQDYNSSTPGTNVFANIGVGGTGSNTFKLLVSGTATTTSYAANGTMYALSMYLNRSGTAQSYRAPDGSVQTLNNNAVSLWVGTAAALLNIPAANGATSGLTDMRMRLSTGDSGTYSFDNLTISKNLPQ